MRFVQFLFFRHALGLYLGSMEKGAFYPSNPSFTELSYQTNCEEILEAMDSKDKATCLTLASCASHINNILEDIYIEARMCVSHPGTFRRGIELNNLRMCEQMPQSRVRLKRSILILQSWQIFCFNTAGREPSITCQVIKVLIWIIWKIACHM